MVVDFRTRKKYHRRVAFLENVKAEDKVFKHYVLKTMHKRNLLKSLLDFFLSR